MNLNYASTYLYIAMLCCLIKRVVTFVLYVNSHQNCKFMFGLCRDMTEDDAVVISSNGQLTLTSVSTEHEGEWRCQATNSLGSGEARTRLTVTLVKGNTHTQHTHTHTHLTTPHHVLSYHVQYLHCVAGAPE